MEERSKQGRITGKQAQPEARKEARFRKSPQLIERITKESQEASPGPGARKPKPGGSRLPGGAPPS
jgi:hypothetical protein